ncbi:MAG: extracellular solute-binding protein [Betaproteobacteria bacterium]|nr:extracellular solute-binding protein [Betaproteobacteria bacterium]NDB01052.1 extracellular solute-binding protein [Betaproteobacteria bacterium]NDE42278.1 extracellular solute-binding protein [Betaproteobacteria bacterium]NDE74055.1 extracellular solute-binding protein [Betaproteobacteria bacterium]
MHAMKFQLKQLGLALAAGALLLAGAARAADPKVLNIYNWSDYIAEDTIKNFEKETGIKVRYDTYDNNEILHAKLVAGKTGYDIVVPGSHFAKTQIEGGLLQKLDRSKLSNWGNLDKGLLDQLAKLDPGNAHLVDWLWGYVTVGININKVKAALGDLPMPENAWSLLFDPKYASKLKSCGVSVLDSASEVLPAALLYLGKPPYSREAADYAEAGKLLKSIRPFVTKFSSSGYIEDMVGGATCLVMGFSGDINIARSRAAEAASDTKSKSKAKPKAPVLIEALVPKTGATLFFDTMAIPKDAKNVENAHLFINYILRPEVHASLTNKVFYANPNAASLKFVQKEVAENKSIFLDAEATKTMVAPDALPQDLRRVQTRTFTSFKAGK